MRYMENITVAGLIFVGQVFVLQKKIYLQGWLPNLSVLADASVSLTNKISRNL